MPAFPISRELTPDRLPAAGAGLTRLDQPLGAGIPQRIELDGEVSVVLALPNGLARPWQEVDPGLLVSCAATEEESYEPGEAPARRAPLRLIVLVGELPVAAVPLVAGLRRTVPDDGGAGGVRVELAVLGWELRVGALRGAGDSGSRLELAWRRADAGSDLFEPPRRPRFRRPEGGPWHPSTEEEEA